MTEEQLGDKINDASVTFAAKLYLQLSTDGEVQNIFISPFSISIALCMTLEGARGKTEQQMLQLLGLESISKENVHQANRGILSGIRDSGIAHVANKLFIQEDYKVLPVFGKVLEDMYSSSCSVVNFSDRKTADVINDWVSKETNQKILKLIESVNGNMAMIIANAIYFKSLWASQFPVTNSEVADFHVNKNDIVKVNMMYQSGRFLNTFHESTDCMALELPHKNGKTSFIAFLPRDIDGLPKVESKFSTEFLNEIMSSMSKRKVKIWLPSFKLEESYSLKSALQKLGMVDLFSEGKSDLTGISHLDDLYAGEMFHKSSINVNEEGTEAAAASAVVIMKRSIEMEESFVANHPFMFCILEKETKNLLFLGRLVKPNHAGVAHEEL